MRGISQSGKKVIESTIAWSVVAVSLLWSGVGRTEECPIDGAVSGDTIVAVAEQIFEREVEPAGRARIEGLAAAGERGPDRVTSMGVSVAPEIETTRRSEANEYVAGVEVAIRLGRVSGSRRDALEAEEASARAEQTRRRWQFVLDAQRAYIDWRVARQESRHLGAYLEEVRAQLEPLEEGRREGMLSEVELADLRSEAGRIEAHRVRAQRRARFAAARLTEQLGVTCPLAVGDATGQPFGAGKVPAAWKENPWTKLRGQVDAFPAVRQLEARAETADATAEVAARSAPPQLSLGLGVRSVGFETAWLVPTVGLSIPLGNPEAPAAAASDGHATALRSERHWQLRRIRARLEASAERYEATLEARRRFQTRYLRRLERRVELFQSALEAGQIDIFRLIRAREERHEAVHQLVVLDADLAARRMRAEALEAAIDRETK